MKVWLSDALTRYFPSSPAQDCSTMSLDAARGERVAFQVVLRNDSARTRKVKVEAVSSADLPLRVRRVGYVPMWHLNEETPPEEIDGLEYLPGLAPDPLLEEDVFWYGKLETNAFWISISVPKDAKPGDVKIDVTVTVEEEDAHHLSTMLVVHPAVLPPRQNFDVTDWFYADALCDWYKTEIWKEEFWPVVRPYFANVAQHGQNVVYVPVFTPPLDGVKRPTQLLGVQRHGKGYRFDWSLVKRYLDEAQAQGVSHFEWTHLFTQWGVANALRIYKGHGEKSELLWEPETGATSPTYRAFLATFLPQFKKFLRAENVMDRSFFHLSDEPHGDEHVKNYRAAREFLRELAPWMKVMDALSDIRFAKEGLTDLPAPSIVTAPDFVKEDIFSWSYFCCGPGGKYLSRYIDTPLAKIRMSGWLFYKLQAKGFLNWGYNYWYKHLTQQLIDPYTVTNGGNWPHLVYGDTFVVYPGAHGPVDSIRWEAFSDSLQDFTLLQAAGMSIDDPVLAEIKDYQDFPKNKAWIQQNRKALLEKLDQ
jgi:hypothetical protein